jgi:hypothetical protein
MQRQQLPTESQVLEDEVLPGTENADQPTEEMSERHDHRRNYIGKVRIELCAKSFILQVYDVLASHSQRKRGATAGRNLRSMAPALDPTSRIPKEVPVFLIFLPTPAPSAFRLR